MQVMISVLRLLATNLLMIQTLPQIRIGTALLHSKKLFLMTLSQLILVQAQM